MCASVHVCICMCECVCMCVCVCRLTNSTERVCVEKKSHLDRLSQSIITVVDEHT